MKKKISLFDILLAIGLGVICVTCVLPFVHLLAVSFSSSSAVAAGKVGFLPVEFTTSSYEYVITAVDSFGPWGFPSNESFWVPC